jgi:hypothetical protein
LNKFKKKPAFNRFSRAGEYMAYNATPLMICYSTENLLLKIGWLAGVSVKQFRDSERVEMTSHYGADCGLCLL